MSNLNEMPPNEGISLGGQGNLYLIQFEIFKLITFDSYIIVVEQYLCFAQTRAHGSSQHYYDPQLQWILRSIPRLQHRRDLTMNLRLVANRRHRHRR